MARTAFLISASFRFVGLIGSERRRPTQEASLFEGLEAVALGVCTAGISAYTSKDNAGRDLTNSSLRRGLSCATSCEALLAVAQVRFKEPRPGAVRRRTASMDRDYLGVPLDRTRWRSNALLGVDGPEGLHGSPPSAAGDTDYT